MLPKILKVNYGSRPKRSSSKAKKLNKLLVTRNTKCEACGTYEFKLTVDHIIPVCILRDLGITDFYEDLENFQVLCSNCNLTKQGRLDFKNQKTKLLLLKYLEYVTN